MMKRVMTRRVMRVCSLVFASVSSVHCTQAPVGLTSSHALAIQDSVRSALADYGRYAAAAQWDSVLRLYSTDSGFRWIEGGRRGGIGAVRQAFSALPPGLRAATYYDSTEIVALAPGVAVLTTYFQTTFIGSPAPLQFAGAISMVWSHEPAGWRIRSGHSSSASREPIR